jgi:hypothetical protein
MQVRAGGWGKKEKARVERREAKGRKRRTIVSFMIQLDCIFIASRVCTCDFSQLVGWAESNLLAQEDNNLVIGPGYEGHDTYLVFYKTI